MRDGRTGGIPDVRSLLGRRSLEGCSSTPPRRFGPRRILAVVVERVGDIPGVEPSTCSVPAKGQRFEAVRNACKPPSSEAATAAGWRAITEWLPVDANAPADRAHKKDLQMQAFSQAADGIRTHDLLHGKQRVGFRFAPRFPCKRRVLRSEGRAPIPQLSPRDHGGLGTEWVPSRRESGCPVARRRRRGLATRRCGRVRTGCRVQGLRRRARRPCRSRGQL
jgi:hypothetical protein